jgi:hypothetical protein
LKRKTSTFNLLPCPRILKRQPGFLELPPTVTVSAETSLPNGIVEMVVRRLESAAGPAGLKFKRIPRGGVYLSTQFAKAPRIELIHSPSVTGYLEGYSLVIGARRIRIQFRETVGLRAALATLRQLLREYGRRLPCLKIRDWPDFPRRGVMLDISRGRVPKLRTLLVLVDHLADFKINEFQLYTEHTYAYRKYRTVWQDWGALTGAEIRKLDSRCRELGIDLVPNQNSFGHLRYFLEQPRLRKFAEVSESYEDASGNFVRHPSTLAPCHPGTLPFLRGLYDELLPNFSSRYFNVGCDETFDLGLGQSRKLCRAKGQGRVYLKFLKRIHRELRSRCLRMMFWGDIILRYPRLIRELPKDLIALNWGYEAGHPFDREAALFARSGVPFYVCPGTSSWMTFIGRHDNALANLRAAARAGQRHGAAGYLITDWGDGGHPQPLAVSYLPYLAGASLSWCRKSFEEKRLVPVLGRDVFCDQSGSLPEAARVLGFVHQELGRFVVNSTPLGTTLAAPPAAMRELFCHDGLNNHRRIPGKNIKRTLAAIERQRRVISRRRGGRGSAAQLALELDLAARMAAQSCKFMLWQQAMARGGTRMARALARRGIRDLKKLDRDFRAYWPMLNKGTTAKCSPFLLWRIADYSAAARRVRGR